MAKKKKLKKTPLVKEPVVVKEEFVT